MYNGQIMENNSNMNKAIIIQYNNFQTHSFLSPLTTVLLIVYHIVECLLLARHGSKGFTHINSFNLYNPIK